MLTVIRLVENSLIINETNTIQKYSTVKKVHFFNTHYKNLIYQKLWNTFSMIFPWLQALTNISQLTTKCLVPTISLIIANVMALKIIKNDQNFERIYTLRSTRLTNENYKNYNRSFYYQHVFFANCVHVFWAFIYYKKN